MFFWNEIKEIAKKIDLILAQQRRILDTQEHILSAIGGTSPKLAPLTAELKKANDSLQSAVNKEKDKP